MCIRFLARPFGPPNLGFTRKARTRVADRTVRPLPPRLWTEVPMTAPGFRRCKPRLGRDSSKEVKGVLDPPLDGGKDIKIIGAGLAVRAGVKYVEQL